MSLQFEEFEQALLGHNGQFKTRRALESFMFYFPAYLWVQDSNEMVASLQVQSKTKTRPCRYHTRVCQSRSE